MLIASLVALNGRGVTYIKRNRVIDELSLFNIPQVIRKRRIRRKRRLQVDFDSSSGDFKSDQFHPGTYNFNLFNLLLLFFYKLLLFLIFHFFIFTFFSFFSPFFLSKYSLVTLLFQGFWIIS